MRRTGLILIAATLVAAAVAACGSNASSQVTSTLKTFATAFADGSGSTACAQLTGAEQQKLVALAQGADTCTEIVALAAKHESASARAKLKDLKVSKVTVTGNSATATLTGSLGGGATLTKSGGRWVISDLPGL